MAMENPMPPEPLKADEVIVSAEATGKILQLNVEKAQPLLGYGHR